MMGYALGTACVAGSVSRGGSKRQPCSADASTSCFVSIRWDSREALALEIAISAPFVRVTDGLVAWRPGGRCLAAPMRLTDAQFGGSVICSLLHGVLLSTICERTALSERIKTGELLNVSAATGYLDL